MRKYIYKIYSNNTFIASLSKEDKNPGAGLTDAVLSNSNVKSLILNNNISSIEYIEVDKYADMGIIEKYINLKESSLYSSLYYEHNETDLTIEEVDYAEWSDLEFDINKVVKLDSMKFDIKKDAYFNIKTISDECREKESSITQNLKYSNKEKTERIIKVRRIAKNKRERVSKKMERDIKNIEKEIEKIKKTD